MGGIRSGMRNFRIINRLSNFLRGDVACGANIGELATPCATPLLGTTGIQTVWRRSSSLFSTSTLLRTYLQSSADVLTFFPRRNEIYLTA